MLTLNRAVCSTLTTGTGTVTLGSGVLPYQSWSAAGAINGVTYSYLITDGTAWELGYGAYTSSGTTLTRNLDQSSTGSLLNLSGNGVVAAIERANDTRKLFGEVVTSSSASSVTFSNIPGSGWRDLEVRVRGRGDTSSNAVNVLMQLNADTGANYNGILSRQATGSATINETIAGTSAIIGQLSAATAPSGASGALQAFIANYTSTVFQKAGYFDAGYNIGTTTGSYLRSTGSINWTGTAAITSVKIFPTAGNFVDTSVVSLYLLP